MSDYNDKTFLKEVQENYEFKSINYIPINFCESGLNIILERKSSEQTCPKCGSVNTKVHDYKEKNIKEGSINGVAIILELKHCRYMCNSCRSTFMQRFENLPIYKGISTEAENYILNMSGCLSFSEIADSLGLCVQTVANRLKEFGEKEKNIQMNTKYKYISMDEVFISRDKDGKGIYYWVLNDISVRWKSNNIRIELGRLKEDVIARLRELRYPEEIKAVSIDMWEPYKDAVVEVLPNSAVVVDRFHLIKVAQASMDSIRKTLNCNKDIKSLLKKDAKLFLLSLFKLTDEELIKLEGYLRLDKKLEYAYFITQELMYFYHLWDYEHALKYISKWETDVLKSGIR